MLPTPTDNLISLLKKDKIIPFIGAGVSNETANLPNWGNLIVSGIEYAIARNIDREGLVEKAKTELGKYNYLRASNYLKELLNAPKFPFVNWIKETFSNLNIISKDLINSILDLEAPIIATTNYDTLLSSINNVSNRKRFVHSEYQDAINSIKAKEDVIIHLHGIYEKPDSIILSERDYENLNDNLGYKTLMQKLLGDYHFLFIGCSKNGVMDEDFSTLFNFIKEWFSFSSNKHFILLHEKEILAKNHLTLLTECNIEAISFGNQYSQLSSFINSINPNFNKKEIKLKKYKNNIENDFLRLAKITDGFTTNKTIIDDFISKTLNSEYDWVDSEKMEVFEKLFSDYNNSIKDKKDKLIFSQTIIQSILNLSELKEKIELWSKYQNTPHKLNPLNYISTACLAYECLLKIPREVIYDLKYINESPIHPYFFDGYLGSFIKEIQVFRKRDIDIETFYKTDKYLFENLKRIIDSLSGFLELNPNSLYKKIEKATISNNLPVSFLVIVTNIEITLRNEHDLNEIYAKLPLEKGFTVHKIEILKKDNQIYLIGFNSKYCFYWEPSLNVFIKPFYYSNQNEGINNIFCELVASEIVVKIESGDKIIKFSNFNEIGTQKLNDSFYQIIPFKDGYIGTKNVDSFYKGNFLFLIDSNFNTKALLSVRELIVKLKEDSEVSNLIQQFKSNHELDDFSNLVDNIVIKKILYNKKQLFLLRMRFHLGKMSSLIILFELDSFVIKYLNIIHLSHCVVSSIDSLEVRDGLKLISSYLDFNRDENIGEYISIGANGISQETLNLKRENDNVRDMFSAIFIDEKSVMLNEEAQKLISISLTNKQSLSYNFEGGERVKIIKVFKG